MSGKVRVVSPEGQLGEVDQDKLQVALNGGYKLESDVAKSQRAEQLQEEYGTIGGQFATGAESFLGGATLGLSHIGTAALMGALTPDGPKLTPEARAKALELAQQRPELGIKVGDERSGFEVGYDTAQEERAKRREANPGIAIGAEAAGTIAPLLLSGGTGALAKGAAATPAALAERAGAAVTKRYGMAAGAAAEGAIGGLTVGASDLNSQQWQDPKAAAEHLLASSGGGVLIGGLTGGLFSGGARLLSRGAQGLDNVSSGLSRPAATELAAPVRAPNDIDGITLDLEARPLSASLIPDAQRPAIRAILERKQAAQGGFDRAVEEGTTAARAEFDGMLRDMDAIDEHAGIAAKVRANALNVGQPVDSTEINNALNDVLAGVQDFQARNSREALAPDGGLSTIERITNIVNAERPFIDKSLAIGDVGDAYSRLDNLKRAIGRARGTKSASVQDLMETSYAKLRGFMEDEATWGELGTRQKTANAAWSNRISAGKDARVRQFVSEAGGNENRMANEWDQLKLSNAGALQNMLRNVGSAGYADVEEAFRRNLRSMARDAVERSKAWGSPELQARAERVVNGAKRLEDLMDRTALLGRDAQAAAHAGNTASLLASVAGMVSPAAGWAIRGSAQLGGGIMQVVTEAGAGMAARVAQGAARMVAKGAEAGGAAGRTLPIPAAQSGLGLLKGSELAKVLAENKALNNPDSPETQAMLQEAAHVEDEEPQLAYEYASRIAARAAYISDKAPKPDTSGALFSPPPVLSPVQERSLQRAIRAAYAPQDAVDRLASFDGSPEDLEALKAVYPTIYKEFQQHTVNALKKLPKPPPYSTRMQIGAITGVATDPTLMPANIERAQKAAAMPDQAAAAEAQAKPKRPNGRKFAGGRDRDQVYASNVDRVLDRQ